MDSLPMSSPALERKIIRTREVKPVCLQGEQGMADSWNAQRHEADVSVSQ